MMLNQKCIEKAPIAIFCYRRPEHLRRTLESLAECEGFDSTKIFLFCDGPRTLEDIKYVKATRAVAIEFLGERANYSFRDKNYGLASSIIDGVGEVLAAYEKVIVVEDDLIVDKYFIKFMNDALDLYAACENVFQVSGFMYDVESIRSTNKALFLPFTTSWGWATWRRAWSKFDILARGRDRLNQDKALKYRFNLNGAYGYSEMLEKQMNGSIDSWAIRWYWSVFMQGGIVLFPPYTLVRNIGFDGSGTHCRRIFGSLDVSGPPITSTCVNFPMETNVEIDIFSDVCNVIKRKNRSFVGRFREFLNYLNNNRCINSIIN